MLCTKVQVICIIHKLWIIYLLHVLFPLTQKINRFHSPIKSLKRKWVREGGWRAWRRWHFLVDGAHSSLWAHQREPFALAAWRICGIKIHLYLRRETNQREVSCRTINTHNNNTRQMSYVNFGCRCARGAKTQLHFRRNVAIMEIESIIEWFLFIVGCQQREIELRRLAVSPPQSQIFADA